MKFYTLLLLLIPSIGSADLVSGLWTDPTPAGPEYSPTYSAQCRLNGDVFNAYDESGLTNPQFSTTIVAVPADVLECRVQSVNDVIPGNPIEGPWTSWASASVAVTPSMPSGVTFIQVRN